MHRLYPQQRAYSLSSEAVIMRQLRRWKSLCWRSLTCTHKRTSMGPSRSCWNGRTRAFQPEEITSKGPRVSCVLSIKVPIQKMSGNLFNDKKKGVLGMTLNCIWWWSSSSEQYPFTITLGPLTWSGNICYGLTYESNRFFLKLFLFNKMTSTNKNS